MENESKEGNNISDGTSLLASQNIGAQKRQKKPTVPPVLQRIRPMSKRKKFKKSLGPDFLEPAELGMQYLRDTYEPKCDICSLTMFSSSTSLYVSEELLHCNNCDAKAHPTCVNLNDEVPHKTQWQCHNCKVCSVCRRNESNEYLMICITCNKGFHVKCHLTPIVDKPKGHWYCQNCCNKRSSHSSELTNGVNDKKTVYSSEESSHSEDNESEPVPKLEKRFKLVLDTESNSEEKVNIEITSEEPKDEQNNNEVSDSSDQNSKDFISNINSNGIDSIKEEANEEKTIKDENNDSQNSDTNQSGTQSMSPQKWTVEEVETFIREAGFPSESIIFKEQEIDGRSLLLLRRMDVLTGLSLKLGPALKIYNHISRLQGRESTDQSNS